MSRGIVQAPLAGARPPNPFTAAAAADNEEKEPPVPSAVRNVAACAAGTTISPACSMAGMSCGRFQAPVPRPVKTLKAITPAKAAAAAKGASIQPTTGIAATDAYVCAA